jgi:hypothetical protein
MPRSARVLLWGSICHYVKREASLLIPSFLPTDARQ